ncbi:MAG TPA: cyclopropane-fatty-acyl-phospholipid synthase family protein [Caulobacteraceae bacterium]|nr:cyclopropane-fatty-acyl-phospholipid synthase family protein [Caulobacteraceae bacterium]
MRAPDGVARTYGDGTGPEIAIGLAKGWPLRLILNPDLALGEAYMEGGLTFEQGDLPGLLDLIGKNVLLHRRGPGGFVRAMAHAMSLLSQLNDRRASRRNVAHHYDLSTDLYRRFLDEDMQYSCAYFQRPDMTLEQAQKAKKIHIAEKLRIQPGMKVLDIGCGWGGLGLELAATYGAQVHGVTLSKEQLAVARARALAAGLAERAHFSLTDYRDVKGPFDRIVSVGMLEHVGAPNFHAYFETVRALLAQDGVALIHTIGRRLPPGVTQPWIAKYIFPGGYIPSLSEVSAAIETADLWLTDVEVQRLHYAETLRHWRERFMAQRDEIARIYDERFCRMWEFYLAVSEIGFRYTGLMILQLQLAKSVDALPITRDYMIDGEREQARPARRRSAA